MKTLTVFTPTYNRGYCLHQVYESLCSQTSSDFEWLVIDDGSTDTTKELVAGWIAEGTIKITYYYKENGGMHTGHNSAYELITTVLNVCIDSDDYMPNTAIELILEFWKTHGNEKVAGIVGLDADNNGTIIGSKFPANLKQSTLEAIYYKHKVTGDKKLILRTEVVKKYPKYPVFEGESFVPLGILYLRIDQDYELLCLNKPLCIVEYLADGSSKNIFNQYKKNPKGFRYSRIVELTFIKNKREKFKKVLHLISSTFFIGDFNFFKDNPEKLRTLIFLPFGIFFHLYILYKLKK